MAKRPNVLRIEMATMCIIAVICAACGITGEDGADVTQTPSTATTMASETPIGAPGTPFGGTVTPAVSPAGDDDISEVLQPDTTFMPQNPVKLNKPRIRIEKRARLLTLCDGDTPVARVTIGLGFAPEGDKEREGDGRTPIGEYYVCTRNTDSKYYLSLGLSYPSDRDAENGYAAGLIDKDTRNAIMRRISEGKHPPWDTALGGEIMIHGGGCARDWTAGCIAVDNDVMDVLFEVCGIGTIVVIEE